MYGAFMGLLTTSVTLTFWGVAVRGSTTSRQSPSSVVVAGGLLATAILVVLYVVVGASYAERRAIQQRLDLLEGVAEADAWGDLDVGISGVVTLDDQSSIRFGGLTEDAFDEDGQVHVAQANELAALMVSCPCRPTPLPTVPAGSSVSMCIERGVWRTCSIAR